MTIAVKNVSKRFGQTQALDNVSLEYGGNKIYGLLGNNGAGKSTLFNIITSLAREGLGIILVSSELKEMLTIPSRVLVLSRGRLTGEFRSGEITREKLVRASAANIAANEKIGGAV